MVLVAMSGDGHHARNGFPGGPPHGVSSFRRGGRMRRPSALRSCAGPRARPLIDNTEVINQRGRRNALGASLLPGSSQRMGGARAC